VAAVRPIESRSVVEQVMTELRRSVLSGALAPGRDLSLRELAEMLQVSIIPVREALRSLESEGLVVTRPGRSARVAPLDLDELQGLYRLRRRLEPEIAQRPAGCCPMPNWTAWSSRRWGSGPRTGP
jgi:DNA-binding GntR family transcriptional regulator